MRPLVASIILCTAPAICVAQTQCAPITDVLTGLAANYGEAPRVTGLMGGHVLIITAAPGGSWTAMEVKPTGEACIVASGQNFETVDAPKPGDDT